MFSEEKIEQIDIKPGGYGRIAITMLGYFNAQLRVGNKTTTAKIYVSMKGDNLLSWPN